MAGSMPLLPWEERPPHNASVTIPVENFFDDESSALSHLDTDLSALPLDDLPKFTEFDALGHGRRASSVVRELNEGLKSFSPSAVVSHCRTPLHQPEPIRLPSISQIDWFLPVEQEGLPCVSLPCLGSQQLQSEPLPSSYAFDDSYLQAANNTSQPQPQPQCQDISQLEPIITDVLELPSIAPLFPELMSGVISTGISDYDFAIPISNAETTLVPPIANASTFPTLQPVTAFNQTQASIPRGPFRPSHRPKAASANRLPYYRPEKPRRDGEHDWVRVNGTTSGRSTRTGKINTFDPAVAYPEPLPTPRNWTSPLTGYNFSYTTDGELKEIVQPAERIADFIYNHPANSTPGRMVLWIQRCPADSARRYPTRGSSKCRFKECPAACFQRTISVGHYRVAFDEYWNTYGSRRDPMIVSAYVHLFCLERFVDFRDVAARFDVRADDRDFAVEPRSLWAPSLGNGTDNECKAAEDFLRQARLSDERFCAAWPNYPTHTDSKQRNAMKPHRKTLCFKMMEAKADKLNSSKRSLLIRRGLKSSHFLIHLGDLKKAVSARKSDTQRRFSRSDFDNSDDD